MLSTSYIIICELAVCVQEASSKKNYPCTYRIYRTHVIGIFFEKCVHYLLTAAAVSK